MTLQLALDVRDVSSKGTWATESASRASKQPPQPDERIAASDFPLMALEGLLLDSPSYTYTGSLSSVEAEQEQEEREGPPLLPEVFLATCPVLGYGLEGRWRVPSKAVAPLEDPPEAWEAMELDEASRTSLAAQTPAQARASAVLNVECPTLRFSLSQRQVSLLQHLANGHSRASSTSTTSTCKPKKDSPAAVDTATIPRLRVAAVNLGAVSLVLLLAHPPDSPHRKTRTLSRSSSSSMDFSLASLDSLASSASTPDVYPFVALQIGDVRLETQRLDAGSLRLDDTRAAIGQVVVTYTDKGGLRTRSLVLGREEAEGEAVEPAQARQGGGGTAAKLLAALHRQTLANSTGDAGAGAGVTEEQTPASQSDGDARTGAFVVRHTRVTSGVVPVVGKRVAIDVDLGRVLEVEVTVPMSVDLACYLGLGLEGLHPTPPPSPGEQEARVQPRPQVPTLALHVQARAPSVCVRVAKGQSEGGNLTGTVSVRDLYVGGGLVSSTDSGPVTSLTSTVSHVWVGLVREGPEAKEELPLLEMGGGGQLGLSRSPVTGRLVSSLMSLPKGFSLTAIPAQVEFWAAILDFGLVTKWGLGPYGRVLVAEREAAGVLSRLCSSAPWRTSPLGLRLACSSVRVECKDLDEGQGKSLEVGAADLSCKLIGRDEAPLIAGPSLVVRVESSESLRDVKVELLEPVHVLLNPHKLRGFSRTVSSLRKAARRRTAPSPETGTSRERARGGGGERDVAVAVGCKDLVQVEVELPWVDDEIRLCRFRAHDCLFSSKTGQDYEEGGRVRRGRVRIGDLHVEAESSDPTSKDPASRLHLPFVFAAVRSFLSAEDGQHFLRALAPARSTKRMPAYAPSATIQLLAPTTLSVPLLAVDWLQTTSPSRLVRLVAVVGASLDVCLYFPVLHALIRLSRMARPPRSRPVAQAPPNGADEPTEGSESAAFSAPDRMEEAAQPSGGFTVTAEPSRVVLLAGRLREGPRFGIRVCLEGLRVGNGRFESFISYTKVCSYAGTGIQLRLRLVGEIK